MKDLQYIRPIVRHVWESQIDTRISDGFRFLPAASMGWAMHGLETQPSDARRVANPDHSWRWLVTGI
jgi:hypothetical protein